MHKVWFDEAWESSRNHQFNWCFTLEPDKGRLLLPPIGGILQACYWSITKWYYSLSLDSSLCSSMYFFIADSVTLSMVFFPSDIP